MLKSEFCSLWDTESRALCSAQDQEACGECPLDEVRHATRPSFALGVTAAMQQIAPLPATATALFRNTAPMRPNPIW
jgi:hypothetical protein